MIYLDNAATSWPKPPEILRAMTDVLERAGGNPGRSGHRMSIDAARVIYDARESVAEFFKCHDPLRVVFTQNATHALNIALKGLLQPGDQVVTSAMEHNSVMRPLRNLEKVGVRVETVTCNSDGSLRMNDFMRAMELQPRLVAMTHASNVVGTLMPIKEIAKVAHESSALLLVDAAQTSGVINIDIRKMGIDLLAFTGHKGLLGPPGSGGLIISERVDAKQVAPLIEGGTGSQSELEEQPGFLPDKFESGTANLASIAGLHAGLRWIMAHGVDAIRQHENNLIQALLNGLSVIPGIMVYGTHSIEKSVAIVSFTANHKRVSELGLRLDEEYGILSRVGLHCAPSAHKTIGTFPEGTVRLAPGIFTSLNDISETLHAIRKIIND
jgi:cysteine desulfurase family protein